MGAVASCSEIEADTTATAANTINSTVEKAQPLDAAAVTIRNQSTLISNKQLNELQSKFRLDVSSKQRELMEKYWRDGMRKDIFHKTMLFCIEASPKLNEIIACGRYCFRDLTKWPKLNRLCQAQFLFFERLIFELNLIEAKVALEAYKLGRTHAEYAQYGLKPHFLDIYQQQFIGLLQKAELPGENPTDKHDMIIGFTRLTSFIIDIMNFAYVQRISEMRQEGRGVVHK